MIERWVCIVTWFGGFICGGMLMMWLYKVFVFNNNKKCKIRFKGDENI